jgi:hypothetical protein
MADPGLRADRDDPSGTRLTALHSDDAKGSAGTAVLERIVRNVEAGVYRLNVDRVFGLDDVAVAASTSSPSLDTPHARPN